MVCTQFAHDHSVSRVNVGFSHQSIIGATDMRQGLKVGSTGKLESGEGEGCMGALLGRRAPAGLQPERPDYPTDLAASTSVWF